MADVPQRLDLGLGKADPDEYFRRLALYSYAVAPLFPGRKAEGQYVPGLRQYATGGRILEDEFPTAYMPHVGRQVMQEGGAPSFEGDVSFAPADMQADAARMEQENRAASDAARAQARQAYSVSPVVDMGINRALRYAERENAPRAMPTAHEFVQRELGRGEPQLPQYDRAAVERMKAGAEGVAHMAAYGIPVVGEVLGAYDMANALRNVTSPEFRKAVTSGDYATTAGGLADVGLSAFGIPGKAAKAAAAAGAFLLPDDAQSAIFGEAAKMSPQIRSALEAAKAALAGGAKPAETWQKYGWAPDPAGKMVSELSDAPARLIPSGLQRFRSGENMTLGEILSHPEYYDLYPSMYNTKLYSELPRDERVRGFYNQMTDTLHASSRLDDRALLGNLLHEPSHRMQIIERMSPGSDPALFENPFQRTVEDREDLASLYGAEIIRNFVAQNPGMKPLDAAKILRQQNIPLGPQPVKFTSLAPEAAEETKKLLQSKIEDTFRKYPDPNYQYKMSLGEVVARLPGERIGMSEAERRAAFPLADENIIVRPPHPRQIENVASPEWERDRAQALELSRQLQREPLPPEIPSRFQIETTDAEEELMRLAQQLEAQKRAGKAFLSGKAGGGGVKSAIKMLGKLLPEGSGYAGTPGKPSLVNLPGIGKVEARPIPEVESAASRYMQTIGRPGEHEVASFPEFNPEFATKVADAFAEMKHRPGDPAVRRAYDALIDETMAQYRAAKDTGIDFRFLKEGQADPYAASPALGYEDIVNRGRLFVFPTEQGFGSSGGLIADNPLLRRAGKVGDKPDAVINDAFRIVHDLYGHFGPGNPFFRAPGEERAYQLHSRMFGKEALPAATLETRGQNSWVNYGPYGEANRSAPGATTHFAEQKIGRMPEWTQAPAPAVGEDVEAYIRNLTGKAEGGEVDRDSMAGGGRLGAIEAALRAAAPYADRTLLSHKDVIKRIPELEEAMKAGVRGEEYQALVNQFKPVKEWSDVPAPATPEEMLGALRPGQRRRVGAGSQIEAGQPVGLRLDIPAYAGHGVWVPTIHEPGAKGRPIAHEATARVSDATLGFSPKDAMSVALGGSKFPFAKIEGKWMPSSDAQSYEAAREYLRSKDWRQIGMDPERHSYFYDRASQDPIVGADEVLQVGPLVLGKNPTYGKKSDFEYSEGGEIEREGFEKGGLSKVLKLGAPAVLKTLEELFPGAARRYAVPGLPQPAIDKKTGKEYLEKTLSDEGEIVAKARQAAQKAIGKGDFKPYFDPAARFDVDPKGYEPYVSTLSIQKARPETIAKYEAHARSPEAAERLSSAYQRGLGQAENAGDWYFMGQLENEFIKAYGPEKGRDMFRERFADAMAATTGGADPTTNLMMAHYGNFLKNRGEKLPEETYNFPFPIGGRYAGTNMDQFRKMILEGRGITHDNPKRYNFAYNFLGEPRGATIDEQMSGLYDPKMTMPTSGSYGHYEGAMHDLARSFGVDPRYFQEVAWAGAKDAKTKGGYRAQPMIQNVNEAIERTSRITGMSPADVVERSLVRAEAPLYNDGGSVIDDALRVSSNIANARELEAV